MKKRSVADPVVELRRNDERPTRVPPFAPCSTPLNSLHLLPMFLQSSLRERAKEEKEVGPMFTNTL
jgi:hypothetical protein